MRFVSMRSPLSLVLVGVLSCLAGIGATILLAPSPQEATQQRAIPDLPPPTTAVRKQQLVDSAEIPCVYSEEISDIKPPAAAGKRLVVTKIGVSPGDRLFSGTLAVEVSGVPIIAFETSMPLFRDLKTGDTGSDVKALELGLVAAKKLAKADQYFGKDTAAAITKIYRSVGLKVGGRLQAELAWGVPSGSTIRSVNVKVGDVLAKDQSIVTAVEAGDSWMCSLPSGMSLTSGQEVIAIVDGVGRTVVATLKQDEENSVTVLVDVPKTGPESQVKILITAAESEPDVLTVPVGALFDSPGGGVEIRPVGNDAPPLSVEVGVVAGGWAEVSGAGLVDAMTVQLRGEE